MNDCNAGKLTSLSSAVCWKQEEPILTVFSDGNSPSSKEENFANALLSTTSVSILLQSVIVSLPCACEKEFSPKVTDCNAFNPDRFTNELFMKQPSPTRIDWRYFMLLAMKSLTALGKASSPIEMDVSSVNWLNRSSFAMEKLPALTERMASLLNSSRLRSLTARKQPSPM